MGRTKVGTRPNEFKYGMALYGAAWPPGDYYYVCGGGGHGLVPRIVWAQYKNGKCSDQVGEYKLGKDTPMRMSICPWGATLLLGNANGGIRRLQIGSESDPEGRPRVIEVSAAFQEVMGGLKDEVGSLGYNAEGNMLAVGFKESGVVKVIDYPSMRTRFEWKLKDPEVKDVDFCHMPGLDHQLLATVGGDGSCQLWALHPDGAIREVAALEVPKGINRARFIRCRFARTGAPVLFVLVNAGRDASFLAAYAPDGAGRPWSLLKKASISHGQLILGLLGDLAAAVPEDYPDQLCKASDSLPRVKAKDQPASAMDISRNGEWIAAGFADGAMRVFYSETLTLKSEAEVSIAFVSHVSFNADNTAVIAVGGDANCYVMELVPRQQAGCCPEREMGSSWQPASFDSNMFLDPAKWPLDALGIKYTVKRFDVAPFYALGLPLRWHLGNFFGKITAPILLVKDDTTGRSRTIMDSTDIVLWAEEKVGNSTSVRFFPPGKEDEVRRWLRISDDLASFFRRELAQAGTSNSAVIDSLLPQESSGMARMLTRFMMGRAFSMVKSKYRDVDADITADKVVSHLKEVRERLSQPNNSGKLLIPEAGLTYAEMQQILRDSDDLIKWGYDTMERHWGKGKADL
eukprot:gene2765-3059_t